MKIGKYNYNRCCKKMPCPICGKPDWCLVSDCGTAAICQRTESQKSCGDAGYFHKIGIDLKPKRIVRTKETKYDVKAVRDFYLSLKRYPLDLLASTLDVGQHVLANMGVRIKNRCWYFPMYDARYNIIGLKIRSNDGKKWCHPGSRLGVYIGGRVPWGQTVYICEGESDTAAMIDSGYAAVGRASATSCKPILKEMHQHCTDINIIADFDKHGLGYREACKLAKFLGKPCNIILHREHKDIREWINSGTFTHEKLLNLRKSYKP